MPQSLFESYMHIVFSTKNRKPWLKEELIRKEMFSYLAGVIIGNVILLYQAAIMIIFTFWLLMGRKMLYQRACS